MKLDALPAAAAAVVSAVSKVAAAKADDHANAFTDEISDLSAINRRTEDKKNVSNNSSVGNAVCEEETTSEWWQHCPHICLPKHNGPLRHAARVKRLNLKQTEAARERAKRFVREKSIRRTVPRDHPRERKRRLGKLV